MTQLDSENANRDLTNTVTVLTHTPSATEHRLCVGEVAIGDGTDDLDGTGGNFELTLMVGGVVVDAVQTKTLAASTTRVRFFTLAFPVPANSEVIIRVKSPNAGDSDVDVTARLFDAGQDTQHAATQSTLTTILADTDELQTDWEDGGRLDVILDSVTAGSATVIIVSSTVSSGEVRSGAIYIHTNESVLFQFNITGADASEAYFTLTPYNSSTPLLTLADGAGTETVSTSLVEVTIPVDTITPAVHTAQGINKVRYSVRNGTTKKVIAMGDAYLVNAA